jgi:GT2 family glycosyltransferase
MTDGAPRVAVVVATFNRASLLPDLVGALRGQTMEDFEAVLVDDGSSDDTHAELQRLIGEDCRFSVIRLEDNRGPARARNLGFRSSTAPLVAFTDDDCAPKPDWLAGLVRAAASADIVQGTTVPSQALADRRPGWFDRSLRIERWSGRYETCNLLLARDVLDRHGGFNETFRVAMGEDTDLGLRATAAGARTAFAADAVVEHRIWPSDFWEYLAQRRRYSEIVELMSINPAARALLKGRVVLRGVHLLVWGLPPLTVASASAGVPWVPFAVAAGWVLLNAHRTRHRPFSWPSRVGHSALHLVAYAYESGCFAKASVRYRTFVL